MRQTVSVIIATHGQRDRSLRRVLASLVKQTVPPAVVRVVGDNAPRATRKLVESFRSELAVTYHPLDRPGSAARARNEAARRCGDADRILVIDDDCVAPPGLVAAHASYGWLPTVVLGFRNHVAATAHQALESDDPAEVLALPCREEQRLQQPHMGKMLAAAAGNTGEVQNYAWTCHQSLPREELFAAGGWWEEFTASGCEDCELALRLRRMGVNFNVIQEPRVHHLDHPKCDEQTANYAANRARYFQTRDAPSIRVRNGGPLQAL